MLIVKELDIQMENWPGDARKVCDALSESRSKYPSVPGFLL